MNKDDLIQEVLNRGEKAEKKYKDALYWGDEREYDLALKEKDFWGSLSLLLQTQLRKNKKR